MLHTAPNESRFTRHESYTCSYFTLNLPLNIVSAFLTRIVPPAFSSNSFPPVVKQYHTAIKSIAVSRHTVQSRSYIILSFRNIIRSIYRNYHPLHYLHRSYPRRSPQHYIFDIMALHRSVKRRSLPHYPRHSSSNMTWLMVPHWPRHIVPESHRSSIPVQYPSSTQLIPKRLPVTHFPIHSFYW